MKTIVFVIGFGMSVWALANVEKNKAMYEMMLHMMKNSPNSNLSASAKCFGITDAKMNDLFERTMSACFNKHKQLPTDKFALAIESCLEPMMIKTSGFKQKDIDRCTDELEEPEDKLVKMDDEIDALALKLEKLYERGASDSEIAKIEAELEAIESKRFAAEDAYRGDIEQTMQMVSKASEKTLHLITLPIYENSRVTVHMFDSGQMIGMGEALPAATFISDDSAKTILAFYKKALPNFKYKDLGNGEYLLIETLPKEFDMVRHVSHYMKTPHVLIRDLSGVSAAARGSMKSNFEIAYREKP